MGSPDFDFSPSTGEQCRRCFPNKFIVAGETFIHLLLPRGSTRDCATPCLILLVIRCFVAVRPTPSSTMATTPWLTARLELPPLPLLRCRTVVMSRGARAAPRSAPSRLPRQISPRTPPVSSYCLSSTRLPRVPLFS
jgi:hypothetical protein